MWNPPQTMPPATASYAPASFQQSYERLQPGGDPNFYSGVNHAPGGQQANHSFTTRYYDAQNPDEVFPRPVGSFVARPNPEADHGSFHSVALQSNQGSFDSQAHHPPPAAHYQVDQRPIKKQRARPMSDYAEYCQDKSARIVLWIISLCVIGLSMYTFFRTVKACFSEDFSVVSELAWESWCGSLLAVMIVMLLLALLDLFLAVFGIIVGMKETKALLRFFFTSSALLGFILILLVLVAWAMGAAARPYATRAMNLMCQERDVFGCVAPASTPAPSPAPTPAPGALPTIAPLPVPAVPQTGAPPTTPSPVLSNFLNRRLGMGGGDDLDGTELSWSAAVALVTQRGAAIDDSAEASASGPKAAPRRLNVGDVAVAFTKGLGQESSGKAGVCRKLERLCAPPHNFDGNTACVCSGQWDFMQKVDDTPSPAPSADPFAPAPGARRLRSLDDDALEDDEDRGSGVSSSSAVARRLSVNPWAGTHGAFCNDWTRGDSDEWCFVSAQQKCHRSFQVPVVSSKGAKLVKSQGPCTDMVDSRAKVVPMGIYIMEETLKVVGALGVASLIMSAAALFLYRHPSKATVWSQVAPGRKNDHYGYGYQKPMAGVGDDPLREQRFQDAQREATRKLTDQTPEDLKLMLYGFYRQAKEGDVKGERPGFWNKKELAKWEYWSRHQGLSRDQAIEGYIRTVALLD